MWKLVIASVLLLVGGNCLLKAYGSEIVDSELTSSVNSIAKALCQEGASHTKRIGRLSTIGQLADYFSALPSESELASCRDEYLEPLKELKNVLDSSLSVCSKEKMEQIDKFHWNYIVASLSQKWRKASDKSLPEALRLFFLHYANEIAEQCKKSLARRLEVVAGGNRANDEFNSLFSQNFGSTIDQLSGALVPGNRVKNFDSFFFLWNQIIAQERKKGHEVILTIDDLTGESVVALVKVKDPSNPWAVQQKCRHDLRPIYQDTVLPVMKLFELGYGQADELSGELVKGNKMIGNWYAITQLCELMLPINFYQDESLKQGAATVMSSFEETEGLGRPKDVVRVDAIPALNNNGGLVQLFDLLVSAGDDRIPEQVKKNLKTRNQLFRQFVKNLASNIKDKLSSKLKNFFWSRKTKDNKLVKQDGEEILNESEGELRELMEDDEESKSLGRTKRRAGSPGPMKLPVNPNGAYDPKISRKITKIIIVVAILMVLTPCIVGIAMSVGR